MDDQSFDRLARTMDATTGRRRLLRGLGAFVAATVGLGTVVAPADARRCRTHRDCRRRNDDSCVGYHCLDGTCVAFAVDCVPGSVCCGNGRCCRRR